MAWTSDSSLGILGEVQCCVVNGYSMYCTVRMRHGLGDNGVVPSLRNLQYIHTYVHTRVKLWSASNDIQYV